MSKEHPVLSTIAAALLGATLVFGGYILTRKNASDAHRQEVNTPDGNLTITPLRKTEPQPNEAAPSEPSTKIKIVPPHAGYDLKSVPPMPKNLPDKEDLKTQFDMLRSFLELPPERLAKIRQSIEKIEAMPLEQKQRLLGLINDTGKSPANTTITENARVNHAKALMASMPQEDQAFIESHTKGYSRALRAAFIEGYAAASKDKSETAPANESIPLPAVTP